MTEVITKKPMKLGTVNLPVGTKLDGLPEDVIGELATRGLADILKPKPHKKEKTEMGL